MLDRIKWASAAGFVVGVVMLVYAGINRDLGWLLAGLFVLVVSLFGGKLEEVVVGKDWLRAKFFPDFAKEVAKQLPAPTEPAPAAPAAPGDTKVLERTATEEVKATDAATAVVTKATGSGSGQAGASIVRPEDVADAKTPEELARRTIEYLQQTMVRPGGDLPALRGLSPHRIAAEQDLFGAILELQSDRHRSGDLGTKDAYELAIQNEIVGWWNDPASLEDGEVTDLARRVRNLIDYRMKRSQ